MELFRNNGVVAKEENGSIIVYELLIVLMLCLLMVGTCLYSSTSFIETKGEEKKVMMERGIALDEYSTISLKK